MALLGEPALNLDPILIVVKGDLGILLIKHLRDIEASSIVIGIELDDLLVQDQRFVSFSLQSFDSCQQGESLVAVLE